MQVQHISAVTLAVQDMARSVDFYQKLGMELSYGGEDASFTTFRAGEGFINLNLSGSQAEQFPGECLFYHCRILYISLFGSINLSQHVDKIRRTI